MVSCLCVRSGWGGSTVPCGATYFHLFNVRSVPAEFFPVSCAIIWAVIRADLWTDLLIFLRVTKAFHLWVVSCSIAVVLILGDEDLWIFSCVTKDFHFWMVFRSTSVVGSFSSGSLFLSVSTIGGSDGYGGFHEPRWDSAAAPGRSE